MISSEILGHYPFFASMTDAQLKAIAAICQERSFPENSILFEENTGAGKLMLLLEGSVDLFYSGGRSVVKSPVCSINPGAIFGVSSLIAPYRYTASARATMPVKVVDIDGVTLRKMTDNDHTLGHVLMQNVTAAVHARLR